MIYPLHRFFYGAETRRLMRYILVGGLSTLIDFTLLAGLKSIRLPTVRANSFFYFTCLVVSFTLNYRWVYADSRSKRMRRQMMQFCVVSVCGLLLNSGIVGILTPILGSLLRAQATAYLPAKIVATAVVLIWNFTANRLWT